MVCSPHHRGGIIVEPLPNPPREGGKNNQVGPLMVRAYINVRATSRSGYIPSSGGAWGGEALLELFSREKW